MKKMKPKMKIQVFLSLFLMMLTVTANAGTYSGGAGTLADPYLISTPGDLNELQNATADFTGFKYFKMTNNIDMTGISSFKGIGPTSSNLFNGTFDGNNFEIQNLTINDRNVGDGANGIALFSNVSGGTIKNLGLKNVYAFSTTDERVAGIAAYVVGASSISNCYVDGGTLRGTYRVGAIVGWLGYSGVPTVSNCWANTSNISGKTGQTWHYVGGIVGISEGTSVISNCTFYGSLSGETSNAKGGISGTHSSSVLCSNCYYISTCGDTRNYTGTTSKTPTELESSATYTGFDFSSVWKMDTYAKLKSFYSSISINSNTNLASLTFTSAKTDLVVSTAALLTVDATTTIDNLTIEPGANVTNANGNKLTVARNFTINSNATNGTGTYVEKGTSSLDASTTKVNQYLSSTPVLRSWYLSSPVLSATPADMSLIKTYNEGSNAWSPVSLTAMDAKKGYLVNPTNSGITNIQFSGTLNRGDINITLTSREGTANKAGFNLIGNPYPCYLDWSLVIANSSNLAAMRSSTLWYRTKISGAYSFLTINGDGIGVPKTTNNFIPPMQAFWVRALYGGFGSLALTTNMLSHGPATDKLLKAPSATKAAMTLVRLQVSNGTNTDEAVIYFSENSSNGLDANDAPKMSNENVEIPEIYTTVANEQMVINGMNSIQLDTPIHIGFVPGNATTFSIKANELSNLPSNIHMILKDNVTSTETDMTDGIAVYSFAITATSTNRFSVIFRSQGATTALNNQTNKTLFAFCNTSGQINIVSNSDVNKGAMVKVYNSVGQQLFTDEMGSNNLVINKSFAAGVYVVKINNFTSKVVVK